MNEKDIINWDLVNSQVESGVLYMVATPIGNMQDITIRALSTLAEVEVIYAEDTRVSGRLLERYGIKGKLRSFRQSPVPEVVEKALSGALDILYSGGSIAYITDAGTPGISDPGSLLVEKVRGAGFKVVPIPGPAANTTLLSVAGIPAIRPLFVGFIPKKKGHMTLMGKIREVLIDGFVDSVIFYESPERIVKFLEEIAGWGIEDLQACVGRELTKLHEEIIKGSVADVLSIYKKRAKIKGEIALVVYRG